MLQEAPREVRRQVYAQEKRERKSGKWSPWETFPAPNGIGGSPGSWTHLVRKVHRNGWIAVLERPINNTPLGPVTHLAIRTATNAELTWSELQRLKNELMGEDRMAIQVYPRQADLIDAADMYHLWVFEPGQRFDFGLAEGQW